MTQATVAAGTTPEPTLSAPLDHPDWAPDLHKRHRLYYAERAVLPRRTRAWEARTLESSRDLPDLEVGVWPKGLRDALDKAGGWITTWCDVNGDFASYEVRADEPRTVTETETDESGRVTTKTKTLKFEAPAGAPRGHGVDHSAGRPWDVTVPLLITEGAAKAMAASSAARREGRKLASMTVPGCWGVVKSAEKGGGLADHMHDAHLHGRVVYLAFDGDWRTNRSVGAALRRTVQELIAAGASIVKVIDIPTTPGQPTRGLDDALAHGVSIAELLDSAKPPLELIPNPSPESAADDVTPAEAPNLIVVAQAPTAVAIINRGHFVSKGELYAPYAAATAAYCPRTEFGIAERWEAYFGAAMRWTEAESVWRWWDGSVWRAASDGDIARTVMATIRAMHDLEAHLVSTKGDDGQKDASETYRSWARAMETVSHINAVAKIIRTLPSVQAKPGDWDSDKWLLNARDGIVDLRTGDLHPHDPAAMCTMIAAGSGRSDIPVHPDLQKVLDGYDLSDPANSEFLRTACGVAATGCSPKMLVHIWGQKDTGKSTVGRALEAALGGGESGVSKASSGFTARLSVDDLRPLSTPGAPRENLLPLVGRRAAIVDEASHTAMDANLLKLIADGSNLPLRGNYASIFTTQSQCTLIMSGNGPLKLPATDPGIAVRLFSIHLTKSVPVLDPDLIDRLKDGQEQRDSVLAWAIRGAVDWYRRGASHAALNPPRSVMESSREYLAEQNPLGTWLEECVELVAEADRPAPGTSLKDVPTLAELRRSFGKWAKDAGVKSPPSPRAFGDYLRELGHAIDATESTSRESRSSQTLIRKGRFVRSARMKQQRTWDDPEF